MAKTTRPKSEVKDDVTDTVDGPAPDVTSEPGPVSLAEPAPQGPAAADPTPFEQPVETVAPPAPEPEPTPQADPVPDAPIPAPPPAPKRSSGFVGMVVGGVIAAALGYGVATYAPLPGLSDQTSQAAQTEAALAGLTSRLAALESAPAPDDALTARVAALEGAAPDMPDLSALTASLENLEARLTALETAPPGAGGPAATDYTDDIAALRAELQAMKGSGESVSADIAAAAAEANARLAEAEAQANQLKAEAEETARKAMARAALGRVQASLESGAPFASALGNLTGFEVPQVLRDAADAGIPSQSALEDAFPPAARAALEASLQADMGATWAERLGSFLQSTAGVRSLTPREGTDPDAVLSRAEAAVRAGDIAAALAELQGLPAAGQAAMAEFAALAQSRVAAEQAVATLGAAIEG